MSVRPMRWLTLPCGLACGKSILGAGVWANAAVPRHKLQRAISPVRNEEVLIRGGEGEREASRMRLKNKCAPVDESVLTRDQRVHHGPVRGRQVEAAQFSGCGPGEGDV